MTLLTCTTILGLALLALTGTNYASQRNEVLSSITERAVGLLPSYWEGDHFSRGLTSEVLDQICGSAEASLFVCDKEGNLVQCSEVVCHHAHGGKVNVEAVEEEEGLAFHHSFEEGSRQTDFVFGRPMRNGASTIGYVYATTPLTPMYTYLYETFFSYIVSALVMLFGAFAVIYTTTKQMTRPLVEMSQAAERFGRGDFSERIPLEGYDEVTSVAEAFNKMADSLEEQERSRRAFVANVTHELRTPMTSIGGYIDGMLDGTIPPEEQTHYLQVVSNEVRRLSRLTSSLLSLSRLEERDQEVKLTPVDIWESILNVMLNLEGRITKKEIHIPDLEPQAILVMAEKDILHQVLYNLIDNAVKYTPVGGEIRLRVYRREEFAYFSVRNTGKGIPSDELSLIFNRFYKTDKSRSLDRSGAGLGLYIVKTLTREIQGEIDVQSDGESYTEFTLKLRRAPQDNSGEKGTADWTSSFRRMMQWGGDWDTKSS